MNKDKNSTVLRVADKYLHWSEGEIFVFDDSFDHEVWHTNENNEARIAEGRRMKKKLWLRPKIFGPFLI